jgi:hypothetical protein
VKHHSALILIGFLTIGAACGCGAHDGTPTEAGNSEGTGTTETDRDARDYEPSLSTEGPAVATVYVSPSGSDEAPGTHDAPVLTLVRAIRLAAERGHSVAVRP